MFMFRKESLTYKQNIKRSVFQWIFHPGAKSAIQKYRCLFSTIEPCFVFVHCYLLKENVKKLLRNFGYSRSHTQKDKSFQHKVSYKKCAYFSHCLKY